MQHDEGMRGMAPALEEFRNSTGEIAQGDCKTESFSVSVRSSFPFNMIDSSGAHLDFCLYFY